MHRSPALFYLRWNAKAGISSALAAASWQCQRCSHTNFAEKNKRRCFLCRSWREAIAPSSIADIAITKEKAGCGRPWLSVTSTDVPALEICVDVMTADVPMQEVRDDPIARHPKAIILMAPLPHDDTTLLSMGSRHFADKNDPPNGASPCKGDPPMKRGEKRKSPSRGLGGMVIHSLPKPLPLTIRPMHSITPPPPSQFRSLPQESIAGEEPRPMKMCRGVSIGNMGSSLTAAAVVYKHTARCLWIAR
jgi:hypothetical protein